jgi:hypothetical protein
LTRRLSVFVISTVNRKFRPNLKSSGLVAFPANLPTLHASLAKRSTKQATQAREKASSALMA